MKINNAIIADMRAIDTPELDKTLAIKDKSQECGRFLDWLREEKNIVLCQFLTEFKGADTYQPIFFDTERLLYEFYDIDYDLCEKEREKLIEYLRKGA